MTLYASVVVCTREATHRKPGSVKTMAAWAVTIAAALAMHRFTDTCAQQVRRHKVQIASGSLVVTDSVLTTVIVIICRGNG